MESNDEHTCSICRKGVIAYGSSAIIEESIPVRIKILIFRLVDGRLLERSFLSIKAFSLFGKQTGSKEAAEVGVDTQSVVVKVRDFRHSG
jgi:hypothetical protein